MAYDLRILNIQKCFSNDQCHIESKYNNALFRNTKLALPVSLQADLVNKIIFPPIVVMLVNAITKWSLWLLKSFSIYQ
ncbi:MAG TPA: hypothetical protein DCM02_09075 [Flavobacterium sp.]|nr:hypothetical protein [Flavobacterium sp.]